MRYSFCAGKIIDNKLYYSDDMMNALCCIDLYSQQATYLDRFPDEGDLVRYQHVKCLEHQGKLYFVPNCGKHIHILDLSTMDIVPITIPKSGDNRFVFSGAVFVDDTLWIFPATIDQTVIKLNTEDMSIEQKSFWHDSFSKHKNKGDQAVWKICKAGDHIYAAILGTSIIVTYSLKDGSSSMVDTEMNKLEAVYPYLSEDELIICTADSRIYEWNIGNNTYNELFIKEPSDNKGAYIVISDYRGSFYSIPNTGMTFFRYSASSNSFTKLQSTAVNEECLNGVINYAEYDVWDSRIVLFPRIGNRILIIENDRISAFNGDSISDETYKSRYYEALDHISKKGIVNENAGFRVDDFVQMLLHD